MCKRLPRCREGRQVTSNIVRVGSANPVVYVAWQRVENRWNNGDHLGAMGESLRTSWMTIDCGSRITLSQPLFHLSSILEKQGQLRKAIDVCIMGARLIGQYDLEGGYMYGCDELEMRYRNLPSGSNSPTPTPTSEP